MDNDHHLIKLFQNLREVPEKFQEKFLIVTLGDHRYGITIRMVTEIVSINKMSKGPDIPSYVKGTLNWHGDRIPVIDIRTWLDSYPGQYNQNTCIAVIGWEDKHVGLVVDQIHDIAALEEEPFVPSPVT